MITDRPDIVLVIKNEGVELKGEIFGGCVLYILKKRLHTKSTLEDSFFTTPLCRMPRVLTRG